MTNLKQDKSLLCFSLYQTFPVYNGGSNRIFNLAKAYSDQFDVSIYGQSLHRLMRSQLAEFSGSLREIQDIRCVQLHGDTRLPSSAASHSSWRAWPYPYQLQGGS